jgi:hypothetical protein
LLHLLKGKRLAVQVINYPRDGKRCFSRGYTFSALPLKILARVSDDTQSMASI